MHKRTIFLAKATNEKEALSKVVKFLDKDEIKEWDWFILGGRFSGFLNKSYSKFFEESHKLLKSKYGPNYFNFIENEKSTLDEIWEKLEGGDTNPYFRGRHDKYTYDDDIMKLSNCKNIIKKLGTDMLEMMEYKHNKIVNCKSSSNKNLLDDFSNLRSGKFVFDSLVYDIENLTNNPNEALRNPLRFWAVNIDLHY